MKNKIIIFSILLSLFFVPLVSNSMPVPQFNLIVIVNTHGSDAYFNFHLDSFYSQDFNLQTQGLTAQKTLSAMAYTSYSLSQDIVSGLRINSILCTSNNPNDAIFYQSNSVIFSPINNENITCTFNNVELQTKTPVLIVPGLTGTELKDGDTLLWPDVLRMVNPFNSDNFMDSLSFNNNLTPIDDNVSATKVVENPDKLFNYTEGLKNEFQNQGYIENQTLFTFPYDWRYGVTGVNLDGKTNSDLLAQKIQDIMAQTGSDKVDVIAHSMGGLIVKKYVMDNSTNNYIGKAVFVGVPNTGSPKSVKVLLQGDNLGVPGLSDAEIKKIAENMPAVYDLLPSQQYYDIKGSYIETIDRTKCFNDYTIPCDVKDLNYSESNDFLNSHGFNSSGITNASSLHAQSFDNYDLRTAGVDVYAINGCKAATLSKVIQTKYNDIFGQQFSYDRRLTVGDNTVPLESATNLPINQSNKYYALVSDHGKMPSQNGIRQEIVNLISGSSLDTGTAYGQPLVTQDISKCELNGKAISVFSPVNIFVTDQNGNKLGLAEDGSVINEIPNADFEIFGSHKFVYVPTDDGQTYTINLTGTGSGTFTLKSQDIQNSQITNTEVFSNLAVTENLTGQVNLAGGTTALSVKQNQNDSPVIILPSATIDAAASEDVLPPVSVAALNGVAGQAGFYRSNVSVNLKATDDLSSVLDVEYNLDNTGYQKVSGDTANFTVSTEGKHSVAYFAADRAGNNSPEQIINFEIRKLPASKDQCKKDGWKNFGNRFKNQGDCVSFVQTGK